MDGLLEMLTAPLASRSEGREPGSLMERPVNTLAEGKGEHSDRFRR